MKRLVPILLMLFTLFQCDSTPQAESNSTLPETQQPIAGKPQPGMPPVPPSPAGLKPYERISSEILHYDLQYQVYVPKNYVNLTDLPVAYILDGAWFLEESIEDSITLAIKENRIPPLIAVFLDARDPDYLNRNRRNKQFICNPKFVEFFNQELIPTIDANYNTSPHAADRSLHGMSFGGLFAMYYAGQSTGMIENLAIMSAATHPCKSVFNAWEQDKPLPVKVFLSVGTEGDTDYAAYRLKPTLEKKGYDYTFTELPYGHVRKVWKPLVDDALVQFFGDRVETEE